MKGTGGGKMVASSEALSLAISHGATMGTFWLLWVSRWLENAFPTIVDLEMACETDAQTKPQTQSPYIFMYTSLYIISLTQNSISSKITFPWSHLHLELF